VAAVAELVEAAEAAETGEAAFTCLYTFFIMLLCKTFIINKIPLYILPKSQKSVKALYRPFHPRPLRFTLASLRFIFYRKDGEGKPQSSPSQAAATKSRL